MILAHRVRFMVTLFVSIILCPLIKTTGDSTGLWTFELCSTGGNSGQLSCLLTLYILEQLRTYI